MNSNTVQKCHAAISALDTAIAALTNLDEAVHMEFQHTPDSETVDLQRYFTAFLPDKVRLLTMKAQLCSLLIEETAAAYVVLVDGSYALLQRPLEIFAISTELPRTIGELDGEGKAFAFHIDSHDTIRLVDVAEKRSVKLIIDGPAWDDGDGDEFAVFSTMEKAQAWCEEHYRGEAVTMRMMRGRRVSDDGQHLAHHWW